jgi:hypothetical protein
LDLHEIVQVGQGHVVPVDGAGESVPAFLSSRSFFI